MALTQLITHRIQRLNPSSPAEILLRDENLTTSGALEETVREMKLTFVKKLSKIHGQFSSHFGEYPVSQWLSQYLEEKLSFTTFTHNAMKQFKQVIDASETLIDAYVFFTIEQFQHTEECYVYIVHHKSGQYIDGELNISDSLHLDTESIALAAKLNIPEWQKNDPHLSYLSLLVWRGEKDLNEAFIQWIGFTNKANVKEQTDAFLEAVDSYTQHQPAELALETKEKVVNYCLEQDKAGKRVVLEELSEQVNEENQKEFAKFVQEQQPELKPEIIPDRSQLRQYIRISGRNELLSMSFDSKCLGETIVYDTEQDSLTIKNIPNSLKSKLIKHLQKN